MVYGSARARELHAASPAIDLHADSLLIQRLVGYEPLRRNKPRLPRAAIGGHVDLPRLLEGGIGAQFFGLVSLPGLDGDLEAVCHRQIDALGTLCEQSGGKLRLARSAAEVEEAAADGAVAALLGLEGAHALPEVDSLDRFAARGLRYLGLSHFTPNRYARPSVGKGGRLTHDGRELVEAAEALGVILDLAHLSREGISELCAMATRPLLVSHTAMAALRPLWRNIDDDQLRTIAAGGGVAGIIYSSYYLGGNSIERVADHIIHAWQVGGEDLPALGSDWDGFIVPVKGLEEASKLPLLTDELLRRQVPARVIAKILRGNVLRLLREVPPHYATPS